MKTFVVILVSTFLSVGFSYSATCISLGNGNWNTPSTWSCGSVPVGGDNITIQTDDTVRISTITNIVGSPVTITINGVFLFENSNAKLRLPCNSVIIITPTGSIQSEFVGQASHSIRICQDGVWSGSDGPLFGPLIIGIGVILPIELTYFDAEANGTSIDFSWQTASELDNDYFTIEGSLDVMNWREVDRVMGGGTTQEVQDYSYSFPNSERFEYFRLKQTDFDGEFSYSDIVSVQLVRDELLVYPNPTNGSELTVNLESNDSGVLLIIHSDGRVAYSKELSGGKLLALNDLSLKTGSYILQIQQSDQIQTERLIVK